MAARRQEAKHPDVNRMMGGHFREGAEYSTWRDAGTNDFLLIHTVAGSGRFAAPAGVLTVETGDAVLLRPGVRHDYATTQSVGHWELAFAHFHPRAEWMPLLDWPLQHGAVGLIRTEADIHRHVTSALRRSARVRSGSPAREELFGMNALEEALLWIDTQNPLTTRTDERVLRVIDYIASHISDPLPVRRLAEIARLSPSRLSHLFAQHTGVSPQRYVERERMLLAGQLLDLTNRSISGIAREVGWDDPLYFSQRFRRFSGMSPTQYRRRG